MHRGGHDSSAGAMGPSPSEGGAGGSSNHRVGPGGRQCHMPVHDSTMDDREGGEGTTATEGGKDRRAGRSVGSTMVTPLSVGLGSFETFLLRRIQRGRGGPCRRACTTLTRSRSGENQRTGARTMYLIRRAINHQVVP